MLADYPHDPLNLMPVAILSRPRVLLNSNDLARCRDFAQRLPWARAAYDTVFREAKEFVWPEYSGAQPPTALGRGTEVLSFAIAAALQENENQAQQLIDFLHGVAQQYSAWPQHDDGSRILSNLHTEKMLVGNLAAAYDLCVDLAGRSTPVLQTIENEFFRPCVEEICYHPVHMMCGNHHLAAIIGSLAVGGAINEPRYIHDAFYGHAYGDGLHSSGIAHQLMHDFLNDGMHWERALGYHFFSLYSIARFAWIAERLGTNLWHRPWPAATEAVNSDVEHHDFDARGDKFVKDFFLAPLFMAHSDGSTATIGDSNVAHISQLAAWGPLYEPAWQQYGDERFAWMLRQTYEQIKARQGVDYLPRGSGDPNYIGLHNFVFVEREDLPPGSFDFANDTKLCLTGQHESGSTLLPTSGFAVLRSDASNPNANNITFRYGPHHAGHQHPDLLSFVWQCDGTTALIDPLMVASTGTHFEQPLHGAWHKQTVAHNTVVVDGISHRPQGRSEEAYEIDRSPDAACGHLLAFNSRQLIKVVAAESTNAYDFPVRLRRVLIVTSDYVFDRFECEGEHEHRWDYMLHPNATVSNSSPFCPQEAGLTETPGMRLMQNVTGWKVPEAGALLTWDRFAVQVCGATDLYIGTGPALPGEPDVTVALTQHGFRADYRSVFYRSATKLTMQSHENQVVIETPEYSDAILWHDTGVLWRRSIAHEVIEESIPFIAEQA